MRWSKVIWSGIPDKLSKRGVARLVNILFVADVFFPDSVGGAGRVAYHLARELSWRHDVHMVTRNPNRRLAPYEILNNAIHVHRFPVPTVSHPGFLFSEVRHSDELFRTIWQTSPPDLVCAHQSLPAITLRFSPRFRGTPFVYCFYSPWHEEYLIKTSNVVGIRRVLHRCVASLMKAIEGWVARHAQKIFVISRYSREQVINTHRCPARRVVLLSPGVDLDAFCLPAEGKEAMQSDFGWPGGKLVFLTARNLVPRMGLENLIAAFAESSVLRRQAMLMIAGDGPLRDRLTRMIQASGLESTIHMRGRVSDDLLIKLYQGSDFFVLPTRALEGFGLVILEAMACGTPVIGTPVGAIPDILTPFDPRLVCEGFRGRHLRRKLESVVTTPAVYRFPPEQCRRFVVDRYSWSEMGRAFEAAMTPLVHPAAHLRV